MTALAPSLIGAVTVHCPACGGRGQLRFDPVSYALSELRDKPAGTIRITAAEHAAETVLWPALAKLLPDSQPARRPPKPGARATQPGAWFYGIDQIAGLGES